MKIIKISATEARNRFFELIELVAYKDLPVIVKKNNKDLVRIIAERKPEAGFIDIDEMIKATFGMLAKGKWPYDDKKVVNREKQANASW